MARLLLLIWILCLQLLLSNFPSHSSSFKLLCNPDDSSALLQLKSSFTINCTSGVSHFHPPSKTTSWKNDTDCCSWDGVTCDTMSGHVIKLNLKWGCLHGQIPPNSSLFHLTHLRSLQLRFNNISGELPSSISNLQQLTILDVAWNNFSGQLPDVFGKLSKLTYLYLKQNNFEGQLPSSLFDLTQLSFICCSDNKFTGSLPKEITGFSQLTFLDLENNLLNGTVPSWCLSLPSLRNLWLGNNQFTSQIGKISSPSFEGISLFGNKLSGHVNFNLFCNLKNLTTLMLSKNSLSIIFEDSDSCSLPRLRNIGLSCANIADFPKFLIQLQSLEYLDLSSNRIQGEMPKWLHEIGKHSLHTLDLSNNQLTSMGQFSWKGLINLDLSFNLLSGDISSSICNARQLSILNLSRNKLTGNIPQCLTKSLSLAVLDLQQNQLRGTLPDSFSTINCLTSLNLNRNQLEGPLPPTLARCTELQLLDVGENQVQDTFPEWLQTLPKLRVLVLRANKFHGVIIDAKSKHPYPSLKVFDVSNNNFSGPLPATYMRNFKNMTNAVEEESELEYMDIDLLFDLEGVKYFSYEDSMLVTIKGKEMVLEKIITSLAIIDLSNNKFQGEISQVIGELHGLKWLNLSYNKFTGAIPLSLENLEDLESLDLSSNMLSGEIPTQLANLNFLSVMNLSQNHLVGKIPQGRQFDTFSNNSYEGNEGLCGPPLSRKCDNESGESLKDHITSYVVAETKFAIPNRSICV